MPALATQCSAGRDGLFRRPEMAAALVSPLLMSRARAQSAPSTAVLSRIVKYVMGLKSQAGGPFYVCGNPSHP